MRLQEKVAIITGAARGMGREIALAFAQEGAKVVLADIIQAEMEALAREVRETGRKAIAIQTDVSREEDVNNLVNKTAKEFGKI